MHVWAEMQWSGGLRLSLSSPFARWVISRHSCSKLFVGGLTHTIEIFFPLLVYCLAVAVRVALIETSTDLFCILDLFFGGAV